ncbi:MFS transporter [Cumulibacter manganitolerans]|uniref:MFS transporter n=1 Tax=Cumulibacter manganitolerans TaxID=1884992 RepID=UPI00129550A4|nr:MFS transporter [Cumulibacter manganitolerans]
MSTPAPRWSAWRVVIWFGIVSLAADMVYEGARSMYGPLLGALGASATVVGLVTGAGEAMALVLRLVFGPLADRTGAYWSLTILGYGLTAVCVPLLAVAPRLGAAGLVVAAVLILAERAGKAVRSPSKSALLAHAAGAVGRGKGFGIHKALDQTGAFAGPLLVAAVIAGAGTIWPGLAVLAIPGAVAMVVLLVVRRAVPDPSVYDPEPVAAPPSAAAAGGLRGWVGSAVGAGLPREFFRFAVAASICTGGLVTFGIIGYHLTRSGLLGVAGVPVVYAGAMLVEAFAALAVGMVYDRLGGGVLVIVPVLVAAVPLLALSRLAWLALCGVAAWALATAVLDSTVKALVAELVDAPRRATAYGVFAGIQGAFAVLGGLLAGWLYDRSITALVVTVAATQLVALTLLLRTARIGSREKIPASQ